LPASLPSSSPGFSSSINYPQSMPLRFIILLLLIGISEYYAFIVVKSALRTAPQAWRTGVMVTYVLLTLVAWSSIFVVRRFELPHIVRNIYIAFALGLLVGKLLILAVMLIDDIRRLALWVINLFFTGGTKAPEMNEDIKGNGITRSVFLSRMALILGGTALTGFIYGVSNRYRYRIRKVRLAFNNLPAAFRGLKVAQISDIHTGSFDNPEAVARGIREVLDQKPDIILFTGDLVNNKADEVDNYRKIFSRLQAPMGVYSTLGNHDYGDYVSWDTQEAKAKNLETLKQAHADFGWRLLMNEHVVLSRGDASIALIGIENWGAKANFPKYGDMKAAYKGLREKNIPFKILLSHDPSHWDAQVTQEYKDIDLTFSGHTHGMQFGVEIPWIKWSPVQYMYKKWAGLYQEGSQYLYVNRGFGFLGYPGRLGILPEITLIELT
jgi:predicted MPP superfamily phosphohydrolase